eukprot:TRINITY_DN8216_c0_g1_i1.p1 TRINITY_DN8216_c0_g1~~TRINITY_DN8216_c0_g1_i1.p1  ORF type:complete len:195 (+),score=25.10 TRINITY_DN8216_c0_g1_i1:186-770(+)
MHIPKLLRSIQNLRKNVMNQGVRIQLSEEIKNEMNPNKEKEKKAAQKALKLENKGKNEELAKELLDKTQKLEELQKTQSETENDLEDMRQQHDEEKQVRIGLELEVEQIKNEYESLVKSGSKQQIEVLENLISNIEESKIRTVRDLNDQLNSLRIGCRLMQKEIAYLKSKQGFHPLDSWLIPWDILLLLNIDKN